MRKQVFIRHTFGTSGRKEAKLADVGRIGGSGEGYVYGAPTS